QPGKAGPRGNDGEPSVQGRDLRVRQAALHQALVVVRAVRGVPAFTTQDAAGQSKEAVEEERREHDEAELDRQSATPDPEVAEQAQASEAKAEERAADV